MRCLGVVQTLLTTFCAAQFLERAPAKGNTRWGDVTGSSSSEGKVILCAFGVLCKGLPSSPDVLCDEDLTCAPTPPSPQSTNPTPTGALEVF
ncbi:unnamed protein product [Durusdinium trenchii]|uniref:Secreted protein n=1 Tax=Durusdinium trenchii TaxID=1381693 RepID=A0ABP0NP10_9DINO